MAKRLSLKSPRAAELAARMEEAYRRRQEMLKARENGKKVREIAEVFGCSKQRVSALLFQARAERDLQSPADRN